MQFLRYEKAPAGMLLLRNANFEVQNSPCGHVAAQKCNFLGTKKATKEPLRACYCSEMLFFRYRKAPAGMLLLRNYTFKYKKKLRACYCSEMLFVRYKKNLRACYCSEIQLFRYKKAPVGMLLLRNAIF